MEMITCKSTYVIQNVNKSEQNSELEQFYVHLTSLQC